MIFAILHAFQIGFLATLDLNLWCGALILVQRKWAFGEIFVQIKLELTTYLEWKKEYNSMEWKQIEY